MKTNFRCPAPKLSPRVAPGQWWTHLKEVAAHFGLSNKELRDGALLVFGGTPTTPEEWLEAAKQVTCTCPKCGGSGTYADAHHDGKCYACDGKGVCDHADRKRNIDYWDHNAQVEARIIADVGAEGLIIRHPTV